VTWRVGNRYPSQHQNYDTERQDLLAIRDQVVSLFREFGQIGGNQARELIKGVMSDQTLTAPEAKFLAQTFRTNAGAFTPEAAIVIDGFLQRHGFSLNGAPDSVPVLGRNDDYLPPSSRDSYGEVADLRHQFIQLLNNDGQITPSEVRSLATRAAEGGLSRAKLDLLAQAFDDNAHRFTHEAAEWMRHFLNNPEDYSAYSPSVGPASRQYGNPRSERVEDLRQTIFRLIDNDGQITPSEVRTLVEQAEAGGLTEGKLGLLRDLYRDNRVRFNDAAADWLGRYLGQNR
jgi:hypothetical protein